MLAKQGMSGSKEALDLADEIVQATKDGLAARLPSEEAAAYDRGETARQELAEAGFPALARAMSGTLAEQQAARTGFYNYVAVKAPAYEHMPAGPEFPSAGEVASGLYAGSPVEKIVGAAKGAGNWILWVIGGLVVLLVLAWVAD